MAASKPDQLKTGTTSAMSGSRAARAISRQEGLLDADQYPVMTFRADEMDGPVLAGMLTVQGLSWPVTMSIELSAVSSRSSRPARRLTLTGPGSVSPHIAGWPGATSTCQWRSNA